MQMDVHYPNNNRFNVISRLDGVWTYAIVCAKNAHIICDDTVGISTG